MSRAERLLDLIQVLRGYRRPVSGAVLAEALGISLRTLYRDIETLNAQGAHIDGEPGVGYVLRPGFMAKVKRTSVVEHYGIKTLMYGTLLPGPDIGRRAGDVMRRVRDEGFEIGMPVEAVIEPGGEGYRLPSFRPARKA